MAILVRFVLCTFFVSLSLLAQASEQWQLAPEKSDVRFLVQSTLHEVHGRAHELSGGFVQGSNALKGAVDIDVEGLTTGNLGRDKNMYQMFEKSKYSEIDFNFSNMDMDDVMNRHEGEITFLGVMTMHGISRQMTIISRGHMQGSTLTCEGDFLINLKDYGLKPPSVLGLIRVKDQVLVQFRIVFVVKGKTNEVI